MKKMASWLYQPCKFLVFISLFAVSGLLFSFWAVFFPIVVNPLCRSNKSGAFKKGAFKIVFELGLPILPVTIVNTCKVYSKGLNLLPGTVQIHIYKTIETSEYTERQDELKILTRDTISSVLSSN